jgi:hypothetical protein
MMRNVAAAYPGGASQSGVESFGMQNEQSVPLGVQH